MIINAPVGGTPGKDCGGFCRFCYFRSVDFNNLSSYSLGCKFCPPNHIGCDYCEGLTNDILHGYKPLSQVISKLKEILNWYEFLGSLNYREDKILTCSCADAINYPQMTDLVSILNDWGFQVHLGYTSGKSINDVDMIVHLISLGLNEINFSAFSINPELRRYWMGDKSPEKSLEALKLLCESIDVNASTVVIPGVIDDDEIRNTCNMLEDWGVKTFILSRFVNFKHQGLIFSNRPIIKDCKTQTYQDFVELVKTISDEFPFKVVGTPFTDPDTRGAPYMLSKPENKEYLSYLPEITSNATIITSKLSLIPLKYIFKNIAPDNVNVVAVEKEVGDLITHNDLETVDLSDLQDKIIIPGGSLVHEKTAFETFNRDGKNRKVLRGPSQLFYLDIEGVDLKDVLEFELKNFKKLIDVINQ